MPGWGEGPSTSLEDLDQASATLPVTEGERLRQEFGNFGPTQGVLHALAEDFSPTGLPGTPRESDVETAVDQEDLNRRYGVPGYLRFNAPTSEYDAAWQSHMALERQMRDETLARSNPSPLLDIGAGLAGAVFDPTNIGIAALTGGLGDAAAGALGLGEAADAGVAVTRVGRVANLMSSVPRLAVSGAVGNAPIVGADWALSAYAGDPDYGMTDALTDIAAGAVLHSGIHLALRAAGVFAPDIVNRSGSSVPPSLEALRGGDVTAETPAAPGAPEMGRGVDFSGEPRSRAELLSSSSLSTPWVPASVDALPAASRFGAWALALDSVANDEPVRVGELIARELDTPPARGLDEHDALSDVPSWRPAPDDGRLPPAAVTTRGTEIPVRYGLAELGDLVTSHTDDLQVNPAFPAELQPRNRARAGAMARNLQLEAELNPRLLMGDVGAGAGAPIVSPAGVVESGNGRTIALRRAAAKGAPAYEAYKAELERQGFDLSGMQRPVLVRMRTEPLTGSQRSALAHEMNADVTERMSASEQAMADAGRMPDALFDQIEPGRGPTTSPAFTRGFIDKVASDQAGAMTDAEGRLSPDGARRVKAAVLAKAYGDPHLVGQIFEGEATAARKLGDALSDAAPAWAKMRSLAARGEIPRVLDITPALTAAMDLVRYAAREGLKIGEVLSERLGQTELFGGESISPATEALLRLMYRNEAMTLPLAADKIAGALKDYARMAGEVAPGPDLFGEEADEGTARQILAIAAEKYAAGDAGELDILRPTGPSRPGAEPARPLVLDVREPEPGRGEPADGGLPDEAQPGSGAEGERSGPAARSSGQQIIAADPELKALAEETDRLASEQGLEPGPEADNQKPDTIAEAVRAAAVCLAAEAEA